MRWRSLDHIFQALKVGLYREEKLLNAIGLQTHRPAARRTTDEVVHLNPNPNPNPNPSPSPNPKRTLTLSLARW